MKMLLPHRYKRIGVVMFPVGLAIWLLVQRGYIKQLMVSFSESPTLYYEGSASHIVNVAAAILGFFAFLAGLYLIAFSREKIEDEMVQRTRLDSFQFAALIQIIAIIVGFLLVLITDDPGEGGMMVFFMVLILLFWLSFIGRFNYILHVKLRQ